METIQFRYDEEGNLTSNLVDTFNANRNYRGATQWSHHIPARQVRVIADNLKNGVEFPYCSPVYEATREQVAFILTNPPPPKKEK